MIKVSDELTAEQTKQISEQLVGFFRSENPPADFVEVVAGSLKPVDARFKLYKALVRTDVYCGGVKHHISNIRLKLDKNSNLIVNTITFS